LCAAHAGGAGRNRLLVVLLAFVLVSFLLNLKELQYLLGAFFRAFVVAILVIFQPELRTACSRNWGILTYSRLPTSSAKNIEVIFKTVERLADVRIGALIASSNLSSFKRPLSPGLLSICQASPEMLETILFSQ